MKIEKCRELSGDSGFQYRGFLGGNKLVAASAKKMFQAWGQVSGTVA